VILAIILVWLAVRYTRLADAPVRIALKGLILLMALMVQLILWIGLSAVMPMKYDL